MKRSNHVLMFITACLGLSLALGLFYIEQRADVPVVILMFLSVGGFVVLFLSAKLFEKISFVNVRRISVYVLVSILFLVLSSAINYAIHKSGWVWDVTKYKQHTLNKNTVDYISRLTSDVTVTAFYVGLAPKYLEDLLDSYEKTSQGRIKTEVVDPIARIGYAAQFGKSFNAKESKAFVRSGVEEREVDFTDKVLMEEDLTNSIIRVTRQAKKVYFLQGHNEADILDTKETGFSSFVKSLSANNFASTSLYLGTQNSIPLDCDVLVIAGPQQHLSADENKIINDYLERGGDALFLIENVVVTTPDKPLTDEQKTLNPSLNEILDDWGVHVADDIAVDTGSYVGDDVGSPATRNYMPHQALIKDLDHTFFIRPRTIGQKQMTSKRPQLRATPFVLTSSEKNSWGETDRTLKVKYDEGVDRPGPVPISYVIWDVKKNNNKPSDTRIIVFTDSDFLTNAFADKYSNVQLGLNIMNWLAELDYQVFLDKKEPQVSTLELTSRQKRTVAVLLFIMPIGVILAGLCVWLRRK